MEKVDEADVENPAPDGDPTVVTSPNNVRISQRLQIKRDNKKKKKPVKIGLQKKGEKSSAAVNSSNNADDDDSDVDGESRPRTKKVFAADPSEIFDGEVLPTPKTSSTTKASGSKRKRKTSDLIIGDVVSLNQSNSKQIKKRKVFDYESALRELNELKERRKTIENAKKASATPAATASILPVATPLATTSSATPSLPRITRPTLVPKRWVDTDVQTEQTGSVTGNQYAILKNNVDLKWANEKLLKENAILKARVDILLDMLVQKTSQLKLLKMTCLENKDHLKE